jgi:phospholipid transport system substrate-binding protein
MHGLRRALARAVVAIAVVSALAAPTHAGDAADGPVPPVAALTDTLLETMRNAGDLGFDGRRDKLAPALRATFDFPFMARLAVGSHWAKLSDDERARFAELFGEMSIATFAARFDGYSGQTFEMGEPREGPRGTRLVPTKLVHPDSAKAPVTISYLMRETGEGWQAVDVYLKGTYSELATKRSEYTSIIKRKGFDALVARIRNKIAELRAGNGGTGAAGEDA